MLVSALGSMIRVLVACTLLASWSAHADNPFYFLQAVNQYRLSGFNVSYLVAIFVPALQLLLATLLLFFPKEAKITFAMCVLVFITFAAAQLSALWRGLDISCGCFGLNHDVMVSVWTMLVPTSLAAISALGYHLMAARPSSRILVGQVN